MTRSSSIESRKFALMRHEFERKFTQKKTVNIRKKVQKAVNSKILQKSIFLQINENP